MIQHDINDDEIRIISSESNSSKADSVPTYSEPPMCSEPERHYAPQRSKLWGRICVVVVILLIGVALVFFWLKSNSESAETIDIVEEQKTEIQSHLKPEAAGEYFDSSSKGFVEITDTTVNDARLTILKPINSVPHLHIGADVLNDSSAVLVAQAADTRGDNGEILGAYVIKGNLLSKGQTKAGYCAIINGKLTIGVADSTPYLEQAIETDGYFFRQYPLVVGGQVVENKLKLSSLRKALAELNGEIVVLMTHNKMTLNEFSQLLVDFGVSNAIYLIGSTAFGFAIDKEGNRVEFGIQVEQPPHNTNYLVWQ